MNAVVAAVDAFTGPVVRSIDRSIVVGAMRCGAVRCASSSASSASIGIDREVRCASHPSIRVLLRVVFGAPTRPEPRGRARDDGRTDAGQKM